MKHKKTNSPLSKHFLLRITLLILLAVFFSPETMLCAAEPGEAETIEFNIMSTSDLHGRVTAFDCETGKADSTSGLSKIYTMIKGIRTRSGKANTLLLDGGDFLYSYSTNYIYDNYPEDIQPIFQAIKTMQYDAITLGNHDFDYPWDYIYNQLDQAGLLSKTLVCNAVYTESGIAPFRSSVLLNKKMTTSSGRTVNVKVGVVGATYSSFSARRYRYSGFLDGADVYQSVKDEAAKLKEKGADIVVAVLHGGVGLLSGANTTIQAGSRIAKLPDINAVICAHSHETFPSTDGAFSGISGVDEANGTIHGTPVVQAGSHAQSFGLITLTLNVDENDQITVTSGQSAINYVTSSTKENTKLVELFAPYREKIRAAYDTTKFSIAKGLTYTNADCVVKDSDLFQLMNNAKIQYASGYIAQYTPEYADYPLISATVNRLDNRSKTISLTGSLTESDISALFAESSSERSSGYVHIYKISGSNLLEWLEYNASIYATAGTPLPDDLAKLAQKYPDASAFLRPESVEDQRQFFIFDGISYGIDLSVAPRYNAKGQVLNYTHRIVDLTYQGAPVTPDMTLIIVMDSLEKRYKFMPVDSDSILTVRLNTTSHDLLMDYIRAMSKFGALNIKADNNWRLIVPDGYTFAFAGPKSTRDYNKSQSWYQKWLKDAGFGYYYLGKLAETTQNTSAIACPEITYRTNLSIPVRIRTYTAAEVDITEVLYCYGKISSCEDSRWETNATPVNDFTFSVKKNGKYSIRVTDSTGAQTITYVYISNYNSMTLEQPIVSTMTNRVNAVKGTSRPQSVIHVALPDGTIATGVTAEDGTFCVDIPMPRFYDMYTIWATYRQHYTSLPVETTVKKTGANQPIIQPVTENAFLVSGKTDKYVTLSLRCGSTVYVGFGESELYKQSELYNQKYNIVETYITIATSGDFTIVLPEPTMAGKTYLLNAIDRNGKASKACIFTMPSPEDTNSDSKITDTDNTPTEYDTNIPETYNPNENE